MTIESKNQLIDKLILSIRTENIDAFDEILKKVSSGLEKVESTKF